VPGPDPGRHKLDAVLEAEGRSSSASTSFSVGTMLPDLAVDVSGGQTESGNVRVVAQVRNIGQSDAPDTDLALWDGEPGTGTLIIALAVGALAPGAEAFVPAEITLTEGTHTVTGWVDRSGRLEEFDKSNNVSRFDITVGPGAQPPPPSAQAVQATSRMYRMGDPVLIEGQAPDGTYCAAVVPNGVWAVGDPAPPGTLSSVTVTSSGGVIPQTQVWVATALGSYDVLLISGACGTGGTIVAASDPGIASGFDVLADPIPAMSDLGLLVLVALIALLGVWLLATRRVSSTERKLGAG
jgi:CARDB